MNMIGWVILSMAAAMIAALALFQVIGRFVIKYEINVDYVGVTICKITITRVYFNEIEDVGILSAFQSLVGGVGRYWRALRLGNRVIGPVLVIHRSNWLFPYVFLTPDDPEEFRRRIRKRVQSQSVGG